MTRYLGNGAINRFLYYCADTYEHAFKKTRNLSSQYSNAGVVWIVIWGFYLICIVAFFLHIFWDLLTGHPFWTEIPRELEVGKKIEIPVVVHNPRPVINKSEADKDDVKLYVGRILKANRYTLKGLVISTTERKIPADELLQFTSTGQLSSPALKQYVSFGQELNEKLHILIGSFPACPYIKRKGDTCFVLNNGDYTPIVDKLNEIFEVDNIVINLTGCQ